MAQADQITDGLISTLFVVHPDQWRGQARTTAVKLDYRNT